MSFLFVFGFDLFVIALLGLEDLVVSALFEDDIVFLVLCRLIGGEGVFALRG